MSNFRQKLKRLLETSYYENKKIDSIYQKQSILNNNKFNNRIIFNNEVSHLYIPEKKSKTKNNSFMNSVNNYKSKEKDKLSLYKKYKKYNSIFENPKKNVFRNILDSYKKNKNIKTCHIFEYSLSSPKLTNNKKASSSTSSNNLTLEGFFNKNNDNKKINEYNHKHKINYRNRNYIDIPLNNTKKRKNSSNRIDHKIIQKIELIENENKQKKVKNLLINRSPIVFTNNMYKSTNYTYTYFTSKPKNENKSKDKNIKKSKNFLDLDDLKDIISSIKNQKYMIIKGKEFNNLNININ